MTRRLWRNLSSRLRAHDSFDQARPSCYQVAISRVPHLTQTSIPGLEAILGPLGAGDAAVAILLANTHSEGPVGQPGTLPVPSELKNFRETNTR